MRKIGLLLILMVASYGLHAQKFYLDVNAGYGFGFPGNVLGKSNIYTQVQGSPTILETKNITGSIGKGFNIQLTPGYTINKHISIELGVNYFGGSNVMTDESVWSYKDPAFNIDADNFSSKKSYAQANQIRLIPSIIFSTDTVKGISGYAKLGLVAPVYGKATSTVNSITSQVDTAGTILKDRVNEKYVLDGKISLGFRGAIGVQYAITDKLSIFGEVYVMSLAIKQSTRVMKSREVNGDEKVDDLKTFQKEIEFVDKLDETSNNPSYNSNIDVDSPRHEMFQKSSLNQMGIQIGVKFTF